MSCPNCNAPMADDQRYCLECGARGSAARMPFADVLEDSGTRLVPFGQPLPELRSPVGAAVPAPGPQERLRRNSGLIAGVGVLLLALLVGVVIGAATSDDAPAAAAAPPPQVITIAGGAAAAPAPATATTGPTGTTDTAATPTPEPAGSTKAAAAETDDPKAPVAATNSDVKKLDKLTGKARDKAVDKLGKNIPTGGKAPKKDAKPAAAGGSFEEIG